MAKNLLGTEILEDVIVPAPFTMKAISASNAYAKWQLLVVVVGSGMVVLHMRPCAHYRLRTFLWTNCEGSALN
jgi:hypothetical protein